MKETKDSNARAKIAELKRRVKELESEEGGGSFPSITDDGTDVTIATPDGTTKIQTSESSFLAGDTESTGNDTKLTVDDSAETISLDKGNLVGILVEGSANGRVYVGDRWNASAPLITVDVSGDAPVSIQGLPTTDPDVETAIWNDNGTVRVSGSLGATQGIVKLSTTIVNTNVGTKQNLYTVPVGFRAIVTQIIVRDESTDLSAIVGNAHFGFNAEATNWVTSLNFEDFDNFDGSATYALPLRSDVFVIGTAGQDFGMIFDDDSVTGTLKIDVLGYLYTA